MRRILPWALVALVLIAGSFTIWRWAAAGEVNLSAPGQPRQGATPVANPINPERLFDPALDPQSRSALSEKLEIENRRTADSSAGAGNPAPKTPGMVTPAPGLAAAAGGEVQSGIYPGSDGMVRPDDAQINNYWVGTVGGQVLVVLAGSEPDDAGKGLVILLTSDGFSVTGRQRVQAPGGIGSLKVTQADSERLMMQDNQGNTITFDLASRSFIK